MRRNSGTRYTINLKHAMLTRPHFMTENLHITEHELSFFMPSSNGTCDDGEPLRAPQFGLICPAGACDKAEDGGIRGVAPLGNVCSLGESGAGLKPGGGVGLSTERSMTWGLTGTGGAAMGTSSLPKMDVTEEGASEREHTLRKIFAQDGSRGMALAMAAADDMTSLTWD